MSSDFANSESLPSHLSENIKNLPKSEKISDLTLYASQLMRLGQCNHMLDNDQLKHVVECLYNLLHFNDEEKLSGLAELRHYVKNQTLHFFDYSQNLTSIALNEAISTLHSHSSAFFPLCAESDLAGKTNSLKASFKEFFFQEMKPNGKLYEMIKSLYISPTSS